MTRVNAATLLRPISALALAGLAVWPLFAQVPADAVFNGFQVTGDFVFELDGVEPEHAEVYHSERAVAYLVMAPELSSPLLINPRTRSVESVHLMKVAKRDNGTIDILADAAIDVIDQFEIDVESQTLTFNVKGKPAKLKPKPYLLGLHNGEDLKNYKPEYSREAETYGPVPASLQALKAQGRETRVRVYFGSWCPACTRLVPKILRVADEVQGSKIDFEYYGLPRPLTDDPEAGRMKIHGVPTAIVFVDGKEVGRLTGNQWTNPEISLTRLLSDS